MTTVAAASLDRIESVVKDCFERRDSDDVETAINGWPTSRAVVEEADLAKSTVHTANRRLSDAGRVVVKRSRVDIRGGVVNTIAPAAVVNDD